MPTEHPNDSAEPVAETAAHDPSGLDLAVSLARSLGARIRRPTSRAGTRRTRRQVDPQASGAYPDERDPQPLDAALGRLVAEHGWTTQVAVHGVFARWDQIVGPELAQHCQPERFTGSQLVVRTDSTAWATQLRLLAGTVVRRLNEELGERTVERIAVLGPSGPSWRRGRLVVRDGRGPRDTYG